VLQRKTIAPTDAQADSAILRDAACGSMWPWPGPSIIECPTCAYPVALKIIAFEFPLNLEAFLYRFRYR
jgi:hypothetical protein